MPGAVGHVVEVAAHVDRLGRLARLGRAAEQEELDLGVRVEGEAEVGGLGQRALEDVARVGVRRGAVGHQDVAEHPGAAGLLRAPGQHLEGRRVGRGEHVRLVDAGEALDRRAVEADALGEGALELGGRDATDLRKPSTSVNQSRTKRMSRSSSVRSTNSCCLSMPPDRAGSGVSRKLHADRPERPIAERLPTRRRGMDLRSSAEESIHGETVPRSRGHTTWESTMDQARTTPSTMISRPVRRARPRPCYPGS